MRVYVACPWKHKETAKEVKKQLEVAGHEVTSRWIDFEVDPKYAYEYPEKIMREEAEKDIKDVFTAQAMLYLNLEKSEGKATELGMFLARAVLGDSVSIFVVGGKQNNVFLNLPGDYLLHLESVEHAIEVFNDMEASL